MTHSKHDVIADLERMRRGDHKEYSADGVTFRVTLFEEGFTIDRLETPVSGIEEAEGFDESAAADLLVDLLSEGERVRQDWAALVNEWRAIISSTDTTERSREQQIARLTERWDGTWDDETGTGIMGGTISLARGLAVAIVMVDSIGLYDPDDVPMEPPVEELWAEQVAS